MSTPLTVALETALQGRRSRSVPVTDLLDDPTPSGVDLFSNDYLSFCTDPQLRQAFLDKLSSEPLVYGTGGSRLLYGNASKHLEFENRMKTFFRAPAALLFNSGYDANVAFWHSVPQAGDAVIFDENVHVSIRDGLAASRVRTALYPFSHNSASSLRDTILHVLRANRAIAAGTATLFVAVESLYSMDGDFAPLPEIIQIVEDLVPVGCGHIVVDEAHSTGIYGTQGRGLVVSLGLEKRISTILHTFGKAPGLAGGMPPQSVDIASSTSDAYFPAVLLCSPTVRTYVINYGRPFIYSTSLPYMALCALNTSFDYIESAAGEEVCASHTHCTS